MVSMHTLLETKVNSRALKSSSDCLSGGTLKVGPFNLIHIGPGVLARFHSTDSPVISLQSILSCGSCFLAVKTCSHSSHLWICLEGFHVKNLEQC